MASRQLSPCPSCGGEGRQLPSIEHHHNGHIFGLYNCNTCNITFTAPFPAKEILDDIYSGQYWTSEQGTRPTGLISKAVAKFNEMRLAAVIRPLLNVLPAGASVLEVGCGAGQLADYLKRSGLAVEVTDYSQDMIGEIERKFGIAGYCGAIEDLDLPSNYDAVIFNNVLEHLPDPLASLKRAASLLRKEGYAFIESPNIESVQFRIFGNSWFGLRIPEHLYHFSPSTARALAEKAGLEEAWLSTFSPRVSAAGWVASLFPSLEPQAIRRSGKKYKLFVYLALQLLALPLALAEAAIGRGGVVRALYRKQQGAG